MWEIPKIEKCYGLIYRITCLKNQKIYIGLSRSDKFAVRLKHHLRRSSNAHLQYAISKYGKDSFSIAILSYSYGSEKNGADFFLGESEKFWIAYYWSVKGKEQVYNFREGGLQGGKGYRHSKESLKKMKEFRRGKSYEEIYGNDQAKKLKNMLSDRMRRRKGIPLSAKQIQAIRDSHDKPIICLSDLKVYRSSAEAERILNLKNINHVLKRKRKHTGGYVFDYYDPKKTYFPVPKISYRINYKPIVCNQTGIVYNGPGHAERELGVKNISAVLRAVRTHTQGLTFSYA